MLIFFEKIVLGEVEIHMAIVFIHINERSRELLLKKKKMVICRSHSEKVDERRLEALATRYSAEETSTVVFFNIFFK